MDLKNGKDIDLDALLKMSVRDKATAFFCGYMDNNLLSLPTEITPEIALKIRQSIKGKGVAIFKSYERLYSFLHNAMTDYLGIGHSLMESTHKLETYLTLLTSKEDTAIIFSKTYPFIEKPEHRAITDKTLIENLSENDKGIFVSISERGDRYEIDATKFIEETIRPAIEEYSSTLSNLKATTEATSKWIRDTGAECIVSPTIEKYIKGFQDNSFYPEIFKIYTLPHVEEVKRKGRELPPSRLYIAEKFSLPTYEESPIDERMFNRVMDFLE